MARQADERPRTMRPAILLYVSILCAQNSVFPFPEVRCTQASDRVPAGLRGEADGATAGVRTVRDVVERMLGRARVNLPVSTSTSATRTARKG